VGACEGAGCVTHTGGRRGDIGEGRMGCVGEEHVGVWRRDGGQWDVWVRGVWGVREGRGRVVEGMGTNGRLSMSKSDRETPKYRRGRGVVRCMASAAGTAVRVCSEGNCRGM